MGPSPVEILISPAVSSASSVAIVAAEIGRTANAKPAANVAVTKPRRVMAGDEFGMGL
ncbi:protein of unknown function [Nitrospira japonica]|uniref:Uncharacterized protein n=1 Tax=Nitrospira japonica TaxID=1325564 RepID=A0A1W1I9B1_9BACT|nr:protein of unknown function [Nitrospira japonica]